MRTRIIETEAGDLELTPVMIDQLRGVAHYWPMEILLNPDGSGHFRLVFMHGEEEIHGLKMQPVDIDEARAEVLHHVNRALIASALPYYLEKGHQGVMVPCAYYKEKAAGMVETGFVFFVGADAKNLASPRAEVGLPYDSRLGDGASPMIFDMIGAIGKASGDLGATLMTVIGLDVRPRLALGGLAMHFVIEGPNVFVVKDPLNEDEPIWSYVVRAGFTTLPYAPMISVELDRSIPTSARRV